MDANNVNRWLTLGANIGVLIGIILLIVKLSQTRDMMRAQTRNEISRGLFDVLSLTATNKELSDAWARDNLDEELTPGEQMMVNSRNNAIWRYWENAHYQYRQGLYDETEFSMQMNAIQNVLGRQKGPVKMWCERRLQYSPEFRAKIDSLLTTYKC